jgi:hypothetical protein
MKLRRWWLGGLALGVAACIVAVLLLSRSHAPEAILAEIVRATPLGSSVADVEAALHESGRAKGMCWTEDKDGKKWSITVRYIDSLELGVPPERSTIEATWHFDADGKLADVSLNYYRAGLLSLGYSKLNASPISLSGEPR